MSKLDRYSAFWDTLEDARASYAVGDWDRCFYRLENAHILGQDRAVLHTLSHWWMLKVGIKRRDGKEVLGQWVRMIASILFSRLWVPVGNTGGANVPATRPMPIRPELAPYFEKARPGQESA